MTKIKILLYTIFLFVQISLTFGQTKFRLGKYKINGSYIVFKDDSTFEYFHYIGCGGISTFGNFKIIKDTIVLDTGKPIMWEENSRKDDSLKVIFTRAFTNEPIPNMQVVFSLNSKSEKSYLSDFNGCITVARNGIDSVYFDERLIQFWNDSASHKNINTFSDNFPIGKYKLAKTNGVDLKILINPQLINDLRIITKENWLIIDEQNIFQTKTDWQETGYPGLTYKWVEK